MAIQNPKISGTHVQFLIKYLNPKHKIKLSKQYFNFTSRDIILNPERVTIQYFILNGKQKGKKTHIVDSALQVLGGSISEKDQQESPAENMNVSRIVLGVFDLQIVDNEW